MRMFKRNICKTRTFERSSATLFLRSNEIFLQWHNCVSVETFVLTHIVKVTVFSQNSLKAFQWCYSRRMLKYVERSKVPLTQLVTSFVHDKKDSAGNRTISFEISWTFVNFKIFFFSFLLIFSNTSDFYYFNCYVKSFVFYIYYI